MPLDLVQKSMPPTSSLAAFGAILRPLILCALGYFGVKVSMAYLLLGGGRYFSLFDLAGLLFLLATYAVCLVLQTKYRKQEHTVAARTLVAATTAPAAPEPAISSPNSRERRREPAL